MPMETQAPETRIKLLEGRMSTAEERITTHGKEIDALTEQQVRTEERGRFRDEQMRDLVSKLDRMDGKIDLISIQPAKENAEKWTKVTWLVISTAIGAVLAMVFAAIGLK